DGLPTCLVPRARAEPPQRFELLRVAELLFEPQPIRHFGAKPLQRTLELLGATLHLRLERREVRLVLAEQAPLFRERAGELTDLDRVEGLLENQEASTRAELGDHLLPAVVRVRGAQDELQPGIDAPELARRLDPVRAGRH